MTKFLHNLPFQPVATLGYRAPTLLALLALLTATNCRSEESIQPERRIVSLSPALTDMIIDLGAGEELVGVTEYCIIPPELKGDVKIVGDQIHLNTEAFLRLRPTMVFAQARPEKVPKRLRELVRKQGMQLIHVELEKLADIEKTLLLLGRHIDRSERAQQLVDEIDNQLRHVHATVANRPRPRTLLTISSGKPIAAGQGTFMDEILTAAGGINALPQGTRPYPILNVEWILLIAPEVIIQTRALGMGQSPSADADYKYWNQMDTLPAVRDRQVYVLTERRLSIPSSRVGAMAELLARRLHPGAFDSLAKDPP